MPTYLQPAAGNPQTQEWLRRQRQGIKTGDGSNAGMITSPTSGTQKMQSAQPANPKTAGLTAAVQQLNPATMAPVEKPQVAAPASAPSSLSSGSISSLTLDQIQKLKEALEQLMQGGPQ